MTDERLAIELLSGCTFLPGSWPKKFVRSLFAGPENQKITVKQRRWIWKLVHRYRRQIKNKRVEAALALRNSWCEMQRNFEDMLDEDSSDFGTRGVYADWLEEDGQVELAAAHRWLVNNQYYPVMEKACLDGTYLWTIFVRDSHYSIGFSRTRSQQEAINNLVEIIIRKFHRIIPEPQMK